MPTPQELQGKLEELRTKLTDLQTRQQGAAAAPTPTNVTQETPAGSLKTDTGKGLGGNLREALQNALNEAGSKRMQNRIAQIYPHMGTALSGEAKGGLAGILDLVRSGVQSDVGDIYRTTMEQIKEEREFQKLNKETELDTFTNEKNERVSVLYNPATKTTRSITIGKAKVGEGLTEYQKYQMERNEGEDKQKTIDSFYKDLNAAEERIKDYSLVGFMTREQLIQLLQAKYPSIHPDDIKDQVYAHYPDISE